MTSGPTPVLVVSNHGHIVGGGEVSLLALLSRLDRSRWAPTVVAPEDGAVLERGRRLGLRAEVVALPSLRRPSGGVVRSVLALRRLCRETGAALVHANGSRAMAYAAPAGKLARRPVIWHVRITEPDGWLDGILARLAHRIVVNSRAVQTRFAWVRRPILRCVHNGVDLDEYRPREPSAEARRGLGVPDGAALVMSVGRFVAYKGYRDLIEAAALVQREKPDTHWVLVGDGELKPALIAQASTRGLEKHVHFPGWREDIPALLAQGDLFVLPSHGEHFGRVLIEAMAMRKPVVATAAGGVPEIVSHEETGLLTPAGDPGGIARAVAALLGDPPRARRMGEAGRRRVETHFSLAQHVRHMEQIYGECIGRHDDGL